MTPMLGSNWLERDRTLGPSELDGTNEIVVELLPGGNLPSRGNLSGGYRPGNPETEERR
jgi:hypothetical protein